MLKNLLFLSSIFLLSGCYSTQHSLNYDSNKKKLSIKTQSILKDIILNNPTYNTKNDQCIDLDFTIKDVINEKYSNLYIRYGSLKNYCFFTDYFGIPYFKKIIAKNYDIRYIKFIKKEKIQEFEFSYFKINKNKELIIIAFYGAYEQGFIIDEKGTLANELKSSLK
ncbi:MAG: hypothetical protein U9N59_15195 [Campylobacterota bacterium]|nr:hypothetical protein [Campylobacterota bacterium]